jgi:drug/metabolite transporter (DMT)-like permease
MLPWLAFAAISLIWGSTWLVHVHALADFTPLGLATIRFSLAGVLCIGIGLYRGEQGCERRELPKLLLSGLILLGLANVLTAWTLTWIPSGVGAVLQSPIPVWMALLTLRREPLGVAGLAATVLGLTGVALVMWPDERVDLALVPAAVCVGSALIWSWAALYQRRHVRSGGMFVNTGLQMLASALVGATLLPFFGGATVDGDISREAWAALAYLTLFGSLIAFSAFLYLTRVWHPARAGSFSYLNPLVAMLLGVTLNHEPLTVKLVAGMVVILCGVALLQWVAVRRSRTRAPA